MNQKDYYELMKEQLENWKVIQEFIRSIKYTLIFILLALMLILLLNLK